MRYLWWPSDSDYYWACIYNSWRFRSAKQQFLNERSFDKDSHRFPTVKNPTLSSFRMQTFPFWQLQDKEKCSPPLNLHQAKRYAVINITQQLKTRPMKSSFEKAWLAANKKRQATNIVVKVVTGGEFMTVQTFPNLGKPMWRGRGGGVKLWLEDWRRGFPKWLNVLSNNGWGTHMLFSPSSFFLMLMQ